MKLVMSPLVLDKNCSCTTPFYAYNCFHLDHKLGFTCGSPGLAEYTQVKWSKIRLLIWGKFEADWWSNGAIYLPFDQAELWENGIRQLPIVNNSAPPFCHHSATKLPKFSMQNVGKITEKWWQNCRETAAKLKHKN